MSAYKKAIHLASGKLSDLYAEVEKAEQNSAKNAKQLRTKYDREINLLSKKKLLNIKKLSLLGILDRIFCCKNLKLEMYPKL